MATKIVKTLKFPNSTDTYEVNAVRLGGKQASDFAASTRKINNKALTSDITLTASDVGASKVTMKTWTMSDIA